MPQPIRLNERLALFNFLLSKFGYTKFDLLRNDFTADELDASLMPPSNFSNKLAGRVLFSQEALLRYDANLFAHLLALNRTRPVPIKLKYYQYFSLLSPNIS